MNSMNYLGKFISNFRSVYNEINAATLTGAIDVVVVEQPDGTFTCSPFHVRFGKIGVLRSREKIVDIEINGEPVDIHMKLGESGEAFFVEEVSADELGEDEFIPPHLACSPIPLDSSFPDNFLAGHDDSPEDQPWKSFQKSSVDTFPNDEITLSSTPKVVVAGGGNVVKTFKAETVENEVARKLSVASADFRPINNDSPGDIESQGSTDSIPSKSVSGIDLTKDNSPLADKTPNSLPSNKRKRRKKSLMKKKNNQRRNNNLEQVDSVEVKKEQSDVDQTIFQIEDLDQDCNQDAAKLSEVKGHDDELRRIQDAPLESDLHFFSDTELTPGCRVITLEREVAAPDTFQVITASHLITAFPHDSRQFTPVQSDSELETKRGASIGEKDESKKGEEPMQQSWRWGELPTSTHEENKQQEAAAHRSMLHNMLGFMKKTKHIRHNPTPEGIYLSELNVDELEPEVAALYFPSSYSKQNHPQTTNTGAESGKDEDAESGNGPSLPHSPNSVEGAIGGPKSLDSDFEEPKHSVFEHKTYGEISLSLCGGLGGAKSPSEEDFLHHIVTYEEFVSDPMMVENPNLVVRIEGKLYNWRTACPIVMSTVIFQKPLPQDVTNRLSADYMPQQSTSVISSTDKRKDPRRGYSSWFTWGVRAPPAGSVVDSAEAAPNFTITSVDSGNLNVEEKPVSITSPSELDAADKIVTKEENCDNIPKENKLVLPLSQDLEIKKKKLDALKEQGYAGSNSSDSDSENDHQRLKSHSLSIPIDKRRISTEKYRKTLRLSSELIAQLNLRDGANELEFSVTTAYQGTSRCKCFLFKWRYDDKIVVSDIDGTITKSDVLGHILPIVGKDWAQSGVAKLFTKIKDNGYKLLYLSARAIGQSRLTREYLKSIKQEDLSLPEGPMLLNPTSLLNAFHTEVIEKKPEEFKISCLRDIQALFPQSSKPFYAGYGNKINDVWAYQAVGIPIFRIFTINHRGELKHEMTQTFQSSYSNMSYIVDQMFPAKQAGAALLEDFSQFVYWREPLPELELDTKCLTLVASQTIQ